MSSLAFTRSTTLASPSVTPERWQAVERLFHESLLQPAEERRAFLDRACEGDDRLRQEVLSLLDAMDDTEVIYEDVASDLASDLVSGLRDGDPDEADGTSFPERLGPYRLLEVLGEGGMSTVYLAEQCEPLPRRVALKLMRWGGARGQALRRFELEREALARMSHPSIAQVFGAGATEHGQPYVVIEHVPGPPITEYCDAGRLTLEERLELFVAVCDGVRHAHEKAVIHRDLKPSNILVTEVQGRPLPKIIDFGIAKSLEPWSDSAAQNTLSRMRVGSPGYMSPESITGGGRAVDTRSDVYSLGVVLCQLLIGARPFDLPTGLLFSTAGQGQSIEPARPSRRFEALAPEERREIAAQRRIGESRLVRRLRGELDWIVLRAVAHDPADRYGSALELAADIEAWLEGRPVTARPPSFAYRARKTVRRHWIACVAAGLVAATVVGFSIRSNMLYRQAEEARMQAEELVHFMLDDLSTQLEPMGHLELLEAVAHRSLAYLESESAGRLERAGRRPAVALRQIGEVLASRGDLDPALQAYERALEVDRRLHRLHPGDPTSALDLARDLERVGRTQKLRGEREIAAAHFAEAERGLRRLIEELPGHAGARLALAEVLSETLALLSAEGRVAEAQAAHGEALAILQDLRHTDTDDFEIRRLLGELHYGAGLLALNWLDNVEGAAQEFEAGAALYRELVESRPDAAVWRHRLAVLEGQGLATCYRMLGRLDEARAANGKALAAYEALVRREPGNGRWAFGLGWELIRRGDLAWDGADLDAAAEAYGRSVEIQSALIERTEGSTESSWLDGLAVAYSNLADVEAERGDLAAAVDAAEASRSLRRRLVQNPSDLAFNTSSLAFASLMVGELRARLGDPAGARQAVTEAEAALEPLLGTEIEEMVVREKVDETQERLTELKQRLDPPSG